MPRAVMRAAIWFSPLLVAGCASMASLPPAPADIERMAWPGFLPQARILAETPGDIGVSRDRLERLQARLLRLRARARLLKAPVIEAQEKLRLSAATAPAGG